MLKQEPIPHNIGNEFDYLIAHALACTSWEWRCEWHGIWEDKLWITWWSDHWGWHDRLWWRLWSAKGRCWGVPWSRQGSREALHDQDSTSLEGSRLLKDLTWGKHGSVERRAVQFLTPILFCCRNAWTSRPLVILICFRLYIRVLEHH